MAIVSSIIKTWLTISRWRLSISTVVRVNVRAGEYGHFRSYITDNINRTSSHHVVNYIKENTEITRDHLTPEIGLHLVTPKCRLWTAPEADAICPDPFWAFYWPGGQVLTRYLLDNRHVLLNKNVLDVGSGCGASAIAASMCGANRVMANDICHVACEAIKLNAKLNRVLLETDQCNLLGSSADQWDVILLGDMFYDDEFTNAVADWLSILGTSKSLVLIGDPDRASFVHHPIREKLKRVATYELHPRCTMENNGLTRGHVWQYRS